VIDIGPGNLSRLTSARLQRWTALGEEVRNAPR
jgi:hypothetical protein